MIRHRHRHRHRHGLAYWAGDRLYRALAQRNPASAMPVHQATAMTALFPMGEPRSRPRKVWMTGVNGWYSSNQRTPAGMAAVGTKALLTNGSITTMSDRLLAPAGSWPAARRRRSAR